MRPTKRHFRAEVATAHVEIGQPACGVGPRFSVTDDRALVTCEHGACGGVRRAPEDDGSQLAFALEARTELAHVEVTTEARARLAERPNLVPLISAATEAAPRFFDRPTFRLEWFVNPEEPGDRRLFLIIVSAMTAEAASDAFDRFLAEWWIDRVADDASGLLSVAFAFPPMVAVEVATPAPKAVAALSPSAVRTLVFAAERYCIADDENSVLAGIVSRVRDAIAEAGAWLRENGGEVER